MICAAALLTGLVACNKELENSDISEGQMINDAIYMHFNLELPTVKSSTDDTGHTNSNASPDYEIGLDGENTVTSILLLLADNSNGQIIAVSELSPKADASKTGYVAKFSSADIVAFADETLQKNIRSYVICNPTAALSTTCKDQSFIGQTIDNLQVDILNATNDAIWQNGTFMMTNANNTDYLGILPNKNDLKQYSTPQNSCELTKNGTPISVERTAARFDYQVHNANKYTLNDNDGQANVTITLTDMALLNLSKKAFAFRRVAASQAAPSVIGGKETKINYVVDTDWDIKKAYSSTGAASNFFYSYEAANVASASDLAWTKMDSFAQDDNYTPGEYKIWRYASENTIPDIEHQQKGISTGVVFKGVISAEPSAPEDLKTAITSATKPIYVYQNKLYGDWATVKKYAEGVHGPDGISWTIKPDLNLKVAFDKVEAAAALASTGNKDADIATAANKSGDFIAYTPSSGKYEVYYYYWNTHNDNGDNTAMGPMEFAVVRNNVYKLSVTNIGRYGLPAEEPWEPVTPDEESNIYFQVSVKVLPWVVRTHDIEF